MFKSALIVAVLLIASTGASTAQSRDEALKMISETLAEINEGAPQFNQGTVPMGYFRDRMEDALKKVSDLKDQLASNQYVRISSVTVGFPWGVSVELEILQ